MQTRLRGQEELNQSFKELIQEFLHEMTPEERLRGLNSDELRRISVAAEQRLRELSDASDSKPHS